PVAPGDRPQPIMPRAEDEPMPQEKKQPATPFDPFHRGIPLPPGPASNPRDENKRLTKLANQAFAEQQYGRAAERFRQALDVWPEDGEGHFLLAQTYFTMGKYHEAVDAIETGIHLLPDWPLWDFHPRFLYGGNESDLTESLDKLDAALKR